MSWPYTVTICEKRVLHTLYIPDTPSCFHVCIRQSTGPRNWGCAAPALPGANNCACSLTFARSNGYSKTSETMPAIYAQRKSVELVIMFAKKQISFVNKELG